MASLHVPPLFLSTVPSLRPDREDPATDALQRCIAHHLSLFWPTIEWSQVIPPSWYDVDLEPLSCDGPPMGAHPMRELEVLYEDLQQHLRARNDSFLIRMLLVVIPDDDANSAYTAFAVYLAQHVPQQHIVIMTVVSDSCDDWFITAMIPDTNEIGPEGTPLSEEKKEHAR